MDEYRRYERGSLIYSLDAHTSAYAYDEFVDFTRSETLAHQYSSIISGKNNLITALCEDHILMITWSRMCLVVFSGMPY